MALFEMISIFAPKKFIRTEDFNPKTIFIPDHKHKTKLFGNVTTLFIYHNHNLVGNCKLVEMVGIDIVVDSKAVEVGNMVEVGIEAFVGS